MKKLIWLVVVLVSSGCASTTSLNKDPRFAPILSQKFVLESDLVVYKHGGKGDYRLIKFDFQGIPSRQELPEKFPYKYESNVVYGVAPKGMEFKITNIFLFRNFETSQIRYEAVVLSDGPFKSETIDVSLLTDGSEVPKFLGEYAIEAKQ